VIHSGTKLVFTFHESFEKDVVVGEKHPVRKVGSEYSKVEYTKSYLTNLLSEHGYDVDGVVPTVNPTQNAVIFKLRGE
jgi:hypothetical protein